MIRLPLGFLHHRASSMSLAPGARTRSAIDVTFVERGRESPR